MASSTQGGSRFTRRILWLAAGIVVVVLVYTAAWFYMAQALEQRVAAAVEDLNGDGVRAHCEEPAARGYPFRIGVFCRSVFYEDADDGFSARAGALRSLANVYQPFRVLSELEGPAEVTPPVFVPLEVRWDSLRASVRLSKPFPDRISVEGEEVIVDDTNGRRLGNIGTLQLHARQQDLDANVAASFQDFVLGSEIAAIPMLEGRGRATVENGIALIESGAFDPRGQSAVIEELVVGVAGEKGEVSVSGPLSVDDNGLVNAELTAKLTDPAAVARILAEVFPEKRGEITNAAAVLSNLDGQPIQLRIESGRVFLGFIPLGEIPAI